MASSANFVTRPHPLPEEMPSHITSCVPRMKITARKSTHFLRKRGPNLPGVPINTEPSDTGVDSTGRLQSPFLYSALSLPSDVISLKAEVGKRLDIPVVDTPMPSAFNNTWTHSLEGSVVSLPEERASPGLTPVAASRKARKSFPGSCNLLGHTNESPTLRYLLLRSLNNPLLRDRAPHCSRDRDDEGGFVPEQRYSYYTTESAALRRPCRKAAISNLKTCLRSVPQNGLDSKSTPLVIIDGSIKKAVDDDGFRDSDAVIYLTEEESLVYERPNNFTVVPSTSDCCRPERHATSPVPEDMDTSSAIAELSSVVDELPSVTGELPIVTAELLRVTAELPRVTAELPRVTAELPRVTAELPRVTAKLPRVTAELPRVTAELPRVTAELPRVTAELPRVTAELPRVTAELPSVVADLPDLPPVLMEEIWLEPPGLLPELEAEEDHDDIVEMPQLLEPAEDQKEPEDRETSRSPEMPILLPVHLDIEDEKHFFETAEQLAADVHPMFMCHNGHFKRGPRRRGVPLGFQRQCPKRTMKTEAYFQGRYAFMAGKKVRDPNYIRGMGSLKKVGSGRGRGRPPLPGRRPRVPSGRGRGRPRMYPEGSSRAMQRNPHVDVVDGVEFLSFETERDLKRFMKTHPSYTLDVSKIGDADVELVKIPLDSELPLSEAVFVPGTAHQLRVRGEPIVLTKTKDITKIKGWRHKVFANCTNPGAGEYVAAERKRMLLVECFAAAARNEPPLNHLKPTQSNATAVTIKEEVEVLAAKAPGSEAEKLRTILKSSSTAVPEGAESTKNTKSAFVSDFLDEFLRTNSELKIGAAAILVNENKPKGDGEIDTKVVWPTKDDYLLPAPLPSFDDNYPFSLVPPVKEKRFPGRPPKKASARVQEAERVRRKYTKRTPLKVGPTVDANAGHKVSPKVDRRVAPKIIMEVNTPLKTVTMETPSYLKTGRSSSAAAMRTAPTSKVSIEPVVMTAADAQFAAMALVSHSWQKTADTLPPLEEIGRMCRLTKETPEAAARRERVSRQFSVIMDRKHVERALRALEGSTGKAPASPDISSSEFHNLSAEEKWEKMMDCSIEGDPFSILKDLDPEDEAAKPSETRRLGNTGSAASKKSPTFASEAPAIALGEPSVSGSRCGEPFCQLGCVCSSLKSARKRRKHCGRAQCMLACRCKETDALHARPEEEEPKETPPEVPAKRRSREIRLPARLKDSVCMWNQAWLGKDSPHDEDFSLNSPVKKRGKYNTKKQRELKVLKERELKEQSRRLTLWNKPPPKDIMMNKHGKDDGKPALRCQSARKQFMTGSAPGSARKGFMTIAPKPMMATTARKGFFGSPKHTAGGFQPQKRVADDRTSNLPPRSDDAARLSNEQPQPPSVVLQPARRILYNPDGSVAGVLRSAAVPMSMAMPASAPRSVPAFTQPEPAAGPPMPRKTARKSVSVPLPWAVNQRKMLERMNATKMVLLDEKCTTEEIVKDVVMGVVRKVSLNAELENALVRYRGEQTKSSRARMGWRRPEMPAPQDAAPREEETSHRANAKDVRRRARRGQRESQRRVALRKGFQQLSNMLEPVGRVCDTDKTRDGRIRYYVTDMANIAAKQLRCDQQYMVETKRTLIKRRMELFAKFAQLLKNMDPEEQKDVVEDFADGMQTLEQRRKMKEPLTLETLCRSTMPPDLSFNSVGREAMDREFFKGWLEEEHFAPDVDDSDLSSSDAETSDDNMLPDSNKNYLKQGPSPLQMNISPSQWPTSSPASIRLQPPGSGPIWLPLHEAVGHFPPGKVRVPRNSSDRSILQQTGPVRTFQVCTRSASFPKIPVGPFEKPRILQRAKVMARNPASIAGKPALPKPALRTKPAINATSGRSNAVSKPPMTSRVAVSVGLTVATSAINTTTSAINATASAAMPPLLTGLPPKPTGTLVPLSSLIPQNQKKPGDGNANPAALDLYDSQTRTFKSVTVSDSILKNCALVPSTVPNRVVLSPVTTAAATSQPTFKCIVPATSGVAVPLNAGNVITTTAPIRGQLSQVSRTYGAVNNSPMVARPIHPFPTTAQSTIGINGMTIPLFRTLPKSNTLTIPVTMATSLTKPNPNQKGPNTTTLLIGVIPTSTCAAMSGTNTTNSLTNAVSKLTGSSDKVTPIMAISLPSTTTSITLDGKKLCFLKPGARILPKITGSVPPAAKTVTVATTPTTAAISLMTAATTTSVTTTFSSAVTTTSTATVQSLVTTTSSATLQSSATATSVNTLVSTTKSVVSTTKPVVSSATKVPVVSSATKVPVVSSATKVPVVSSATKVPNAATVSLNVTASNQTAAVATVASDVLSATPKPMLRAPLQLEKFRFVATVLRSNNLTSLGQPQILKERLEIAGSDPLDSVQKEGCDSLTLTAEDIQRLVATTIPPEVPDQSSKRPEDVIIKDISVTKTFASGGNGTQNVADRLRLKNIDLERISANPELQVIKIGNPAAMDVGASVTRNCVNAKSGNAAADKDLHQGKNLHKDNDLHHNKNLHQDKDLNQSSSSVEEVDSAGSNSPEVVVIDATEDRDKLNTPASFVDHHEKLLAQLKELTVVRLPPKIPDEGCASRPENAPKGVVKTSAKSQEEDEDWPKIVAFTSISEDEFLCEQEPGKDDGVLVLDGVVENPLDVKTLIT